MKLEIIKIINIFYKKDIILPFFFFVLFIIIHTVYLINNFVFIYDQVASLTTTLELWRNKKISLIGPSVSLNIQNRQIYFGGVSYFIDLIFLLIGRFDPYYTTFTFMLFSSLMLFFLYFGVKNLINKNAAIVMMSLYSFFPFFMDRAHFLWNPNYQFALLPILVYLISLFHFNKKPVLFFLIGLVNGILFQLHYMYSFTLIGIAFYYLIIRRVSLMLSLLFIIGFIIGICNLLIFELRHNFYNLQTLLIYLKHSKQLSSHWFSDYYLTTQIFFLIILLTYLIKKYLNKNSTIILISSLLFITGLYYVTITAKTKNYPKNWHYKDELRVYNIIKKNLDKIKNFNIFEFYVATGTTQKYFLKRDNIKINFNDYYNNNYLYVVYKDKNFWRDPAYEVNSFKPYKILNVWKINNYYNLYLLNRQK